MILNRMKLIKKIKKLDENGIRIAEKRHLYKKGGVLLSAPLRKLMYA